MKNGKAPRVAALSQKKLTLNNSIFYNLSFSPKESNRSVNRILTWKSLLKGRAL
jgi:hypothetical protein